LGQNSLVEISVVTDIDVTVTAPVIKAIDIGCDDVGDVRVLEVHLVQMVVVVVVYSVTNS
jgi:hypothetical protein